MAKESTTAAEAAPTNGAAGLMGDLSVIRSILVGEQMSSVEQRLHNHDQEIKSLKAELEATHVHFTKTIDNMKANFEETIRKMEANHTKDKEMLSQKIDDSVTATKHSFGQVLTELGKIMMK